MGSRVARAHCIIGVCRVYRRDRWLKCFQILLFDGVRNLRRDSFLVLDLWVCVSTAVSRERVVYWIAGVCWGTWDHWFKYLQILFGFLFYRRFWNVGWGSFLISDLCVFKGIVMGSGLSIWEFAPNCGRMLVYRWNRWSKSIQFDFVFQNKISKWNLHWSI